LQTTTVAGFRIQDLGFGIWDSGFKIQDSGFKIQDSGFLNMKKAERLNSAFSKF